MGDIDKSAKVIDINKISLMKKIDFNQHLPYHIFATSILNIPIHMHQCKELIFVVQGSIKIKINFNNYLLNEGDFILINSYELHSLTCKEECLVLVLMIEDLQFNGKLYAFDIDFYRNYNLNKVKKIKRLMVNLYEETHCCKNEEAENLLYLLKDITGICDRYFQIQIHQICEFRKSDYEENTAYIERIRRAFESHYNSNNQDHGFFNKTVQDIIGEPYTSRRIKNYNGKRINDIVKVIQLYRAEVLLLGTDMSIESISKEIGFPSITLFRDLFKQYFHISPLKYRKIQQSNLYPMAPMNHCEINPNCPETLLRLHKSIEDYEKENKERILWDELRTTIDYTEFLIGELQIEDKFSIIEPNKTINGEINDDEIAITITISNQ